MSQFKFTSHGRTRRPKNVRGNSSTAQAVTLGAIPAGDAVADIAGSVSTENQRFLHLLLDTDTSGGDRTVTVYGFSYAMNRWAPLKDARGNAVSIAADNTSTYQIFEIHGVDRVCFVGNGPAIIAANDFFFAATSTF